MIDKITRKDYSESQKNSHRKAVVSVDTDTRYQLKQKKNKYGDVYVSSNSFKVKISKRTATIEAHFPKKWVAIT